MSTSFYGRRAEATAFALDTEEPPTLRAFPSFLGLERGYGPDGEADLPEVRRAVMRAPAPAASSSGG